jgi:hypothetical protein
MSVEFDFSGLDRAIEQAEELEAGVPLAAMLTPGFLRRRFGMFGPK